MKLMFVAGDEDYYRKLRESLQDAPMFYSVCDENGEIMMRGCGCPHVDCLANGTTLVIRALMSEKQIKMLQ